MWSSALPLLAMLAPVAAEVPDSVAAVAAVENYFTLRANRDAAAISAMTIPEGKLTRVRFSEAGAPQFRYSTWAELTPGIGRSPAVMREAMHDVSVAVSGGLATVTGSFSVWLDGSFAYCGSNIFELVRRPDGRWLIHNVTWTERTSNCPGAAGTPPG